MFEDNKYILTLGFMKCLRFHEILLVVSSPLLVVFMIGFYSEGLFCVLLASRASKRCTWSLIGAYPILPISS
jgi:hypothetical protein